METVKCYKYRAINKNLLDSLITSRFYFSNPLGLNDPFDCNVDILNVTQHAISKSTGKLKRKLENFYSEQETVKRFQENINELGIGSFSLKPIDTLLWSHYGDEHNGVCLQYDFPLSFLQNEENIFGASKVEYLENRVSDWLIKNISLHIDNHYDFITSLLRTTLTSKAPDWRYEEEYRIIRPESGLYEIPRNILGSVIFGLRTSKEDRDLIKNVIGKYYKKVEFKKIIRNSNDFGLTIEDI